MRSLRKQRLAMRLAGLPEPCWVAGRLSWACGPQGLWTTGQSSAVSLASGQLQRLIQRNADILPSESAYLTTKNRKNPGLCGIQGRRVVKLTA